MLLNGPFEKFVVASPVSVMMRGIIENLFHPERLDRLFEETAVTQYTRSLPFTTVAQVMGEVVFNVNPSVHAALKDRGETLPVSVRAFYQKLNGVEPNVSAVLVRDSAVQLTPVIRKQGLRTPLLAGYNIRILDGNHFAATEHRLLETRTETAAPLRCLARHWWCLIRTCVWRSMCFRVRTVMLRNVRCWIRFCRPCVGRICGSLIETSARSDSCLESHNARAGS